MKADAQVGDLLRIRNLSVKYGDKKALHGVNLSVKRGAIHAVTGDHGSGKSTLVKVVSGLKVKDEGELIFDGQRLDKHNADRAIKLGILTICHESGLVQGMSVYENIFLNREIKKNFLLNDKREMRKRAAAVMEQFSLDMHPDTPVRYCNTAQQQMIEIARISCFPAKLVIIDELANNLTPENVEVFHHQLSLLHQMGTTVLYITKDMDEVLSYASQVTVLKNGSVVESTDITNMDKMQLVRLTYWSMSSRKQLEQSNLELFYMKNFSESIINNIPIPMVVLDSRRNVVIINKALQKRYNVAIRSYVGHSFGTLFDTDEEGVRQIEGKIRRMEPCCLRGIELVGHRGKIADLHILPIIDEDASYMGTILLLSTTEDDPEVEKQLLSFQQSISFFRTMSGIAHEINNPLGIITNYLELIKNESSLDVVQNRVRVVEEEIRKIRSILKNYPRVPDGKNEQREKSKLEEVIVEVIEVIRPVSCKSEIEFDLHIEGGMLLNIAPDPLKQVIVNLILNGIEAMPDGGVIRVSSTRTEKEGIRYAGMTIRDSGTGIDDKSLPHIFEPFYSTKSDKDARGLGLTICKDIVEQFNGTVEVERSSDPGTGFSVLFPVD
jgi:two-component system sensor histidine kinase AtoS